MADPQSAIIDLGPYFGRNSLTHKPMRVLVGRDKGKKVREETRFDDLILKQHMNRIDVVMPRETLSVNPSFLEEFIKNAVIALKPEGFRKTVFFSEPELYNIQNDLDEAIDRVQRAHLA